LSTKTLTALLPAFTIRILRNEGLRESENEARQCQNPRQQDQQIAEFGASTGLFLHLAQKAHIGEIHLFEPAKVKEVNDDGYGQRGECKQKCRE
jgi:hypothetical protein